MAMRPKSIKPRNPVMRDGGLARRGGAHGRTRKAQRRAEKVRLTPGDHD
jgi:hypothetical protein